MKKRKMMRRTSLIITAIGCLFSTTMSLAQEPADTIRYDMYPIQAQQEIKTIIEGYEEADNPFVATYLGSEFHDYFYFPFKGENGVYYDFGYRNNNLGSIPFGEFDAPYPGYDAPENISPGAKLVGIKFLIHWEYELSYVICCEGTQDTYPAMLPRISKITYYKE
jgi:hypothetical protein